MHAYIHTRSIHPHRLRKARVIYKNTETHAYIHKCIKATKSIHTHIHIYIHRASPASQSPASTEKSKDHISTELKRLKRELSILRSPDKGSSLGECLSVSVCLCIGSGYICVLKRELSMLRSPDKGSYIYMCVSVCVCVCIYIYIYIYICTHTHTQT
jgi:hypothetical protein